MLKDNKEAIKKIMETFSDHKKQKSHARHISKKNCKDLGLNILLLEDNQPLQDAVLSTHHALMHTFTYTDTVKIIENQNGVAYVETLVPVSASFHTNHFYQ